MRIVIAGGSGFLGRPLTASLQSDGHEVVTLTRSAASKGTITWSPDGTAGAWASALDGAGAVINLAGESIAKRWTTAQKQRIVDSRVNATRSLVAAIKSVSSTPRVFVSGSAVGYYGPRDDRPVDDDAPAGSDFLARVCVAWESEATRATTPGTRVVCIRTGIVLEKDGGALKQMLPPFRFGAGGPVGSGRQYWPWIHRDDWIAMVKWAIATPNVSGPLNATAPTPETSRAFGQALGRALHRPSFMPAPAFALRLLLGEMADTLLLSGQRAVPAKAQRLGYTFKYSRLDEALRAIFS